MSETPWLEDEDERPEELIARERVENYMRHAEGPDAYSPSE